MSPRKGGRNPNGAGTIYQRANGLWAGQCYVTEGSGRRIRRTVYGRSRREVERKVEELIQREERGLPAPPEQLTLAEYLDEWLSQIVTQRVRPNTLNAYRFQAERYLIPDLGSRKIVKLTARELRLYIDALQRRGVGLRTIGYVHATLRAALEDAVREEILEKNVAKLVRAPRPQKAEVSPLTLQEVRQLLSRSRDHRLYALLVVFALLGLRRSEALGLEWEDVDLEARTLRIRQGLQRIDGKLQLLPTKTARSQRTIPLPEVVVQALARHRDGQEKERVELAERWPSSTFVFTTPIGTAIDPRNCTRIVQRACRDAEVRVVRLHDFRHGAVSVLLALGVPPRTAMDIAGHSTIEMTMNVYGHVSLDEKREALDRVGRLFELDEGEEL